MDSMHVACPSQQPQDLFVSVMMNDDDDEKNISNI
jgi:hypothetical protein